MQLSISRRPRLLKDVFGQDAIIKELITRQTKYNWPQAILLKGPTGTGKTTIAQIIAMAINCLASDTEGNPCGKCSSCQSILNESFSRDTQRLDGSQSGKDDVVDITSGINIAPMYDMNTIIIIEESDQLSAKAKSALLKVLEKPKHNVYFILLSMVSTGLPMEIQSRCQVYNLKPFTTSDIMYALKDILEKEHLWESDTLPKSFKLEGLKAIAESSQGSLRAAVQGLEKCLIGEYWTPESIQQNVGAINEKQAFNLLELLANGDPTFFDVFEEVDFLSIFDYTYNMLSGTYYALCPNIRYFDLLQVFDDIASQPFLRKAYIKSKFTQFIVAHPMEPKKVVRRFSE
jgi:DNA polymerase III subunit gamma/tau